MTQQMISFTIRNLRIATDVCIFSSTSLFLLKVKGKKLKKPCQISVKNSHVIIRSLRGLKHPWGPNNKSNKSISTQKKRENFIQVWCFTRYQNSVKTCYYTNHCQNISLMIVHERRETRETNSRVTRPLDLVLMTKCSGYFLNSISKPYHGFPLDSGPGQSSDVRYLLTLLWCQTLLYCSTN